MKLKNKIHNYNKNKLITNNYNSNNDIINSIKCKCGLCLHDRKNNEVKEVKNNNLDNKKDLLLRNNYLNQENSMIDYGFILDKLYNNKKYNFSPLLINDLVYFFKGYVRYYIYYNYKSNTVNLINEKDKLKFNIIFKWFISRKLNIEESYKKFLIKISNEQNIAKINDHFSKKKNNEEIKYLVHHLNNKEINILNEKDVEHLFSKLKTNKIWKDIHYIMSMKDIFLNKIPINIKFRKEDKKNIDELELYKRSKIIIKIIYKIIPPCSLLYINEENENIFCQNLIKNKIFLYFKYINYKIFYYLKLKNIILTNFNTKWILDEFNTPWFINAKIYDIIENKGNLKHNNKKNIVDYEEYIKKEKKINDLKVIKELIKNRFQKIKYRLKMYNIIINEKILENEDFIINIIFNKNKDILINMLNHNKSIKNEIDNKILEYFPNKKLSSNGKEKENLNLKLKKNRKINSLNRFERIISKSKDKKMFTKTLKKNSINNNTIKFNLQKLKLNLKNKPTKLNIFFKLANKKNKNLLKTYSKNLIKNNYIKIRTSSNCFKFNLNKLKKVYVNN